jgi:putative ABC transport system substrate-binding protein
MIFRNIGIIVTLAFTIFAAPLWAEAQRPARSPQVGMLMPVAPADAATNIEAFRQGLRELGYVEGQNIAIEPRYSAGRDERLRDLAAELVGLKVDVIVTWGTPAARAAKAATRTIPIVTASLIDPVGTGLVAASRGRAGTSQG